MTSRKPTIDDVARVSNVGRTTVSRVLNDGPNVRAKVRARVLEAVRSLGYQVNLQARSLAGGGSSAVLLICASDTENEPNSYYQGALEIGALRVSARIGFELATHTLALSERDIAARILQLVEDSRCVGIILTPPFSDWSDLVHALLTRGINTVRISPGRVLDVAVPAVGMDDEAAGFALARYLLDLGHRRFGYIAGLVEHLSAERRLDGARRALRHAGLGENSLTAVRGNFTFRSGVELLPSLLADAAPSAVICANDDMAVGALFAAHRADLRVPQDLSIASFDDTPISALVWPPLTTVHQPIQEMSARAIQIIAERHAGHDIVVDGDVQLLPFTIVERGSVGRVIVDRRSPT